jgi:KaiC/GvpD/RAD55 family RecA-like ATPase
MGRDINDVAIEGGADAVRLAVANGRRVPKGSERTHADVLSDDIPLDVTFADELPAEFTPPDELVQGLLTVGGGSVLYGDSNSGKTFLVIDLAAAVARGVEWMGKRTERGMVVYLAAESPASVRSRLQAYQKYHGERVPNFAIVQNPVNLFESDADASAIIATIQRLEVQRGEKARLIVGDTLARLSAGANENAGQDMSRVIERFDRIRAECKAHFMLIHHSGKNAAAGSRGWSGVRAAVDAEIEITDSPTGRCAEITKVRDLGTKGERIGFRLDVVELGVTKWGSPATTCVVAPESAPVKPVKSRKLGPVEGAVQEFLRARKVGAKAAEISKHFDGEYARTSVYRACKTLAEAGVLHHTAGIYAFAGGAQ